MIYLFFGLGLGAVLSFLWFKSKSSDDSLHLKQIEVAKVQLDKENKQLLQSIQEIRDNNLELERKTASLKTIVEQKDKEFLKHKDHYEEKLRDREKLFAEKMKSQEKYFIEQREKWKLTVENTANKIFSSSVKSYREETEKNLAQTLRPFREDIQGFKKSIQEFETKEQGFDKTLKDFRQINEQMRDDYKHLTQILKGNTKAQGHFGEVILENILEKSGLRKDEEFFVQGKNFGVKSDTGAVQKPDVIVKLPDNKHIVIDAKSSFSHYQEYCSVTTESEKQILYKKILHSTSSHIENLSSKYYFDSEDLKTPDFTLMFIPNEGIFSLVTQAREIFEKAWNKSIVLVSPTTLYATLRTIASIWKIEKQNKNAKEIAKQSGLLYDKLVGFVDDISAIGKSLKATKKHYDSAYNKLEGRGSIIRKATKIKKLGADAKKALPASHQSSSKTDLQ